MALRLEDKKLFVKEVNAVAGESVTAVAADYRGLSVAEMTELRKQARNAGVYMRVVKNTLARRAIEGTDFECMKDTLKGPLLLAFAKDDPGAAARVIKDFAKGHDALQAVSLSAGGQLLPASDLSTFGRSANAGSSASNVAWRNDGTDVQVGTYFGRAFRNARSHPGCPQQTRSGIGSNKHYLTQEKLF